MQVECDSVRKDINGEMERAMARMLKVGEREEKTEESNTYKSYSRWNSRENGREQETT